MPYASWLQRLRNQNVWNAALSAIDYQTGEGLAAVFDRLRNRLTEWRRSTKDPFLNQEHVRRLKAEKTTWSSRRSVDLKTTRAPFESSQDTTSSASSGVSLTMRPRGGRLERSSEVTMRST